MLFQWCILFFCLINKVLIQKQWLVSFPRGSGGSIIYSLNLITICYTRSLGPSTFCYSSVLKVFNRGWILIIYSIKSSRSVESGIQRAKPSSSAMTTAVLSSPITLNSEFTDPEQGKLWVSEFQNSWLEPVQSTLNMLKRLHHDGTLKKKGR